MKKKIFIGIIILSLFILSIFKVNALKTTLPLIGKLIVVDAGHGGTLYIQQTIYIIIRY